MVKNSMRGQLSVPPVCAIVPPMTTLRRGTAAFACMLALVSCRPADQDETVNNAADPAIPRKPATPLVEAPRDRGSLLIALTRAASAAALGLNDTDAQRDLDGDRFEFRLRFGCPLPAGEEPADGPFNVRYDKAERRLRVSVAPTVSADDPTVTAVASEQVEAVEGFWIDHPWILATGCPARPAAPEVTEADSPPAGAKAEAEGQPASPVLPSAAIVQFLTENDPRTDRRGNRPYAASKTLPEGSEPSPRGYDLVLSGRLRALADGRVIACTVTSTDSPPTCLISALFGKVRIEHPETGEIIAEWGRD